MLEYFLYDKHAKKKKKKKKWTLYIILDFEIKYQMNFISDKYEK